MSIAIGRETSHSCAALVTRYCLAHQYMRNKHFLSGMLVATLNCKKCTIPKRYRFFTATTWTPPSGHVLSIIIIIIIKQSMQAYCMSIIILQSELVCGVPSLLQSHGS